MPQPAPSLPDDDATRLSKVVAALVPCSRREAEQYIAEGWVRVDGRVVEQPQFRVRGERVEVTPNARLSDAVPATFLVHKPVGAVTRDLHNLLSAESRWAGDESRIRRIKSHGVGLVDLLPLPPPASGLAVLSQDGRIVRKLNEDANTIEQELVAEVSGTLVPGGLERLGRGITIDGAALPPARVSWQSERRLRLAVKGIDPQWIPALCAQVGLRLDALKRIRIGRVAMAGLPPGQWRYLGPQERF